MTDRSTSSGPPRTQQDSNSPPAAQVLDETIEFWQPRTARRLTREDARQMIENVTGFFRVLRGWDHAAAGADAEPEREQAA